MGLCADAQVGGRERPLNRGDELMMWNGAPAIGGARCSDFTDFIKVHMGGSAVQSKIRTAALDELGLGIENGNHGGGSFRE